MGLVSRVKDKLDDLRIELEASYCEDCYCHRPGVCPCDGETNSPSCHYYAHNMLLAGVIERCADEIIAAL